MTIKTNLLLLTLLVTPLVGRATFYLEPRVSYLSISGTPNIGDIGRKRSEDISRASPSIAVGYEISPRFNLEFRYTRLGEVVINKSSATRSIFPGGEVILPATRDYKFAQDSDLVGLAMPWRLGAQERLAFFVTPIVQLEVSEIKLTEEVFDATPTSGSGPGPRTELILKRSKTSFNVAAEFAAHYAISDRISARLSYTFSPLKNFQAHLFGFGVGAKF